MTDIVQQLETAIAYNKKHYEVDPLHKLALIEIKRLRAELAGVQGRLDRAMEHLEWFISEDETNRGDEPKERLGGQTWNQVNAYWIENVDAAIAFVAEIKGG